MASTERGRRARRFQHGMVAGLVLIAIAGMAALLGWVRAIQTSELLLQEVAERQKQADLAEASLTSYVVGQVKNAAAGNFEVARLALLDRIPDTLPEDPSRAVRDALAVLESVKELDPIVALIPGGSAAKWNGAGTMVAVTTPGAVEVFEVDSGGVIYRHEFLAEDEPTGLSSMSWDPTSEKLLIQPRFGPATIIEPRFGKTSFVDGTDAASHKHATSVAWSPDGSMFAVQDGLGILSLWEAKTLSKLHSLVADDLIDVAWSPDSRILLALSNLRVRVFDVRDGKTFQDVGADEGDWFAAVTFEPSGERFITSSAHGVQKMWRVGAQQPEFATNFHKRLGVPLPPRYRAGAAWSPSGKRFVSWDSSDTAGSLRVWDVAPVGEPTLAKTLERFGVRTAIMLDDDAIIEEADGRLSLITVDGVEAATAPLTPGGSRFGSIAISPLYDTTGLMSVVTREGVSLFRWGGELRLTSPDRERLTPLATLSDEDLAAVGLSGYPRPETLAVSDPVALCDASAAHPEDPQRSSRTGVWLDGPWDGERAVKACVEVVSENPGDARLRYQLGRALKAAGRGEDALEELQKAADAGHAMATWELADSYRFGNGVPKDARKARELMSEAVDAGVGPASADLGQMTWDGEGGPSSLGEAIEIWTVGASTNDPRSHLRLAMVAETGGDSRGRHLEKALLHYGIAIRIYSEMSQATGSGISEVRRNYGALVRRGNLARVLDPDRVANIWPRVRDWTAHAQNLPLAEDASSGIASLEASHRHLVQRIKTGLERAGIARLEAGGDLDRQTVEAIRTFEMLEGMGETGLATPRILRRLTEQGHFDETDPKVCI